MRTGPEAIIPISGTTWRWLKQGKPKRLGLHYRLTYGWNAYWFGVNNRLQQQYLSNIQHAPLTDPVFILGLWRSGTTLVHELLSGCPTLFAPTTQQCMNASSFVITKPSQRGSTAVRPMDLMEISADSPQEDEFALLALGVPSVYRAFLDPARIEELEELLQPDYWRDNAPIEWEGHFLKFLRMVMSQAAIEKRLAIKSPTHSFRVKAIHRMFPKASYIWITRSPEEILYSNRKMWQAMFIRYGLSEYSLEKLDQFLMHAFKQAANCLNWVCSQMECDELVVIDFSQLKKDPASVIAIAGERLGLGKQCDLHTACEALARQRSNHQPERYQSQLLSFQTTQVFRTLNESQYNALLSHGLAA